MQETIVMGALQLPPELSFLHGREQPHIRDLEVGALDLAGIVARVGIDDTD